MSVAVIASELVKKDARCEVDAESVEQLGEQLRAMLSVDCTVVVMCLAADFGDWAQLDRVQDVAKPGSRVKLVTRRYKWVTQIHTYIMPYHLS